MDFVKMHGAGNDFIIVNNIEEKIPDEKLGDLAEKICHRRILHRSRRLYGDRFSRIWRRL